MRTKHIIKRLQEDTEYQEFFKKAMAKFDIKSPAELKDPAKKKEFFSWIDANYKGKSEGTSQIKEAEAKIAPTKETLKKNIKQFVVDNIEDVVGYEEYEFEIIKTHPAFREERWDAWDNGDDNAYDETVQKMIEWARKQIIKELV